MDGCFWRRQLPAPEPTISHDEVLDILDALTDIKAWTRETLRILQEEEDDDDEP